MATDLHVAMRKVFSVNPASGEILREFQSSSDADVRAAVTRARAAQPAWQELGVKRRAAILREFQHLLRSRKSAIAELITREAGKPLVEALLTEVLVVLDATRFCVDNAFAFLREQPVPHGNLAMKTKTGHILRQPHGVIGIISPWNYPFSIPANGIAVRASHRKCGGAEAIELTSLTALELSSLLHEAGVPKNVFQVVVGDGATGSALLNAAIDKLVFTGNLATGKRIAQAAASRLLPVVLELGGKDAMLVLDDADVEVASSGAVLGGVRECRTGLSFSRALLRSSYFV